MSNRQSTSITSAMQFCKSIDDSGLPRGGADADTPDRLGKKVVLGGCIKNKQKKFLK